MFTFGSVPKDPSTLPGIVQAPTGPFAPCAAHAWNEALVPQCGWLDTSSPSGGCDTNAILPNTDVDAEWSALTPKVAWRGSDWPFLTRYGGAFGGTDGAGAYLKANGYCDATKEDIERAIMDFTRGPVPPRLRAAVLSTMEPENFDIKFSTDNSAAPWTTCIEDRLQLFGDSLTNCDFKGFKAGGLTLVHLPFSSI